MKIKTRNLFFILAFINMLVYSRVYSMEAPNINIQIQEPTILCRDALFLVFEHCIKSCIKPLTALNLKENLKKSVIKFNKTLEKIRLTDRWSNNLESQLTTVFIRSIIKELSKIDLKARQFKVRELENIDITHQKTQIDIELFSLYLMSFIDNIDSIKNQDLYILYSSLKQAIINQWIYKYAGANAIIIDPIIMENSSPKFISMLLNSGLNLIVKINPMLDYGYSNYNLIYTAIRAGKKDIVENILDHIARNEKEFLNRALWFTCIESIKANLKELLEIIITKYKFDVNIQRVGDKITLLISAAIRCKAEIVKLLIDNGANINLKDYLNRDALSYAAEKGHAGIVELLLSCNIENINNQDIYNKTALDYAKEYNYPEIVELIESKNYQKYNNSDSS